MGMLQTCCGFYCAMTSLVGIYFFIILAIMEYRGNSFLVQIIQNVESEIDSVTKVVTIPEQINNNTKGTAYIITAAIQVIFTGLCYWCGNASIAGEQAAADAEKKKQLEIYARIESQPKNMSLNE